ncbi:MAG: 2-iminoacetate synthase ThiH, partial [Gemmatimonadetes bacterium]|nr:2-iminoacetate synthase ThiH [Gemmatimonadota bacterium]
AGVRRLGIGTLLGLAPWREETLALATHAEHLYRRFGRTEISFSFPRIREAAGAIEPRYQVTDRQLTQMMCALRLVFPDAGIVLSTREAPALRDGLSRIAVTMMSAGSRTEPGGYEHPDESEKQFEIEDHRTAAEVTTMLAAQGIDPVWKDWEEALHG